MRNDDDVHDNSSVKYIIPLIDILCVPLDRLMLILKDILGIWGTENYLRIRMKMMKF